MGGCIVGGIVALIMLYHVFQIAFGIALVLVVGFVLYVFGSDD
ncbi:hypothetical protein T231_00595 [Tannerella sp. oral taxon BU063 isolate Cell 6/7/9]|uniref:Uncharacterized protein n=1 Tax=Tannerella sp. oral taxon BU063 isolate Cell 6/7/9 TaxID=1411021 RepID=W2CYL5_9BACT|nr:hypothetical protein T231_00595 [Tannerella sp. oral taxon BU063 isolate Cell 6/7/9]